MTVCHGRARADEDMRVCALCVSVNHCYFSNEFKKKPMLPKHPHCKCNAVRRDPPDPSEITLDFPKDKVTAYLFAKPEKSGIMTSWGYDVASADEAQEVYDAIAQQVTAAYAAGEYRLHKHNEYGQRINIDCRLPGKRDKAGRTYSFWTGWIVYPYGKLYCCTPFGGRNK